MQPIKSYISLSFRKTHFQNHYKCSEIKHNIKERHINFLKPLNHLIFAADFYAKSPAITLVIMRAAMAKIWATGCLQQIHEILGLTTVYKMTKLVFQMLLLQSPLLVYRSYLGGAPYWQFIAIMMPAHNCSHQWKNFQKFQYYEDKQAEQ